MKLTLALTIFTVFQASASLYSQTARVNINVKDANIIEVLGQIRDQSGYTFAYNADDLTNIGSVTLNLNDTSVDEVLAICLRSSGVTYVLRDNVIVLRKTQRPGPQPAQQQIGVAAGVVKDANGKAMPGASVLRKGTAIGVATDAAGGFRLQNVPYNSTLVFSFIGKTTQEVVFTGQPSIDVILEDTAAEMDAVVVTGIFDRPRESYTGAVTTINKQQLEIYRGQNLIQTLRNIDPAISIFENNEWGSDPNRLPELSIRGSSSLPRNLEDLNEGVRNDLNTPLVIMDGFEISLQKLMDYNDDEIESINILKDASATAIYGSRGANGVIVINSKQPTAGKLRINFKATFDVEMPDLSSYNLMDAAEKLQFEWDHGFYEYAGRPSTDQRLKNTYYERLRDVLEGTDTYWLGKPLRTALSQKYNLRLEGGSREFRWGVTAAYGRTGGVMKNSHRDNFSGQIILQYNYKNIIFRNQTEIGVNKGVNSNYGSFSDFSRMNPYYKTHDANGALVVDYGGGNYNPLYNASLENIDENAYTSMTNNFSIEWTIVQGLTLRGRFGISKGSNTSDRFLSPHHTTFLSDQYTSGEGMLRRGRYTYGTGESMSYDGNLTLGYVKTFNEKHQLYAGLNYTISQSKSHSYTFVSEGFTNEKLSSIIAGKGYQENGMPTGSETFTRLLGLTGNANYTYDNRLFADVSFRMDGSSQFGSRQRFAPFWSLGLGWNIHNERFLEANKSISTLRLRLSYGQTGSQQFEAFQALSKYTYYIDDRYGNWGGARLSGLGNEDLKWQITDQFNAGIEAGLFNNLLNMQFDVYVKKTSDLVSDLEITNATGFSSYPSNIGEVRNTGFEASLTAFLIRNSERNITWSVTGKIAYNKNEITKLSDAIKIQNALYLEQDVDIAKLYYEGRSQNSIYAVRSLGIDPSTGNEIFLDRYGNVTDTWHPADKVYMGVETPEFQGNAGTMFRYRNLTLNLSFGYQFGGYAYNQTLVNRVEVRRASMQSQNLDRMVMTDRWNAPGDMVQFKRIPARNEPDEQTRASSRFVMKNDIFRLQNASIEYRLDAEWLRKAGIDNARLSINMSDVFYIASIKRERGTNYPFSRRIGASLSLMF